LIDMNWPLDGASDHGTHEALYLSDPDGIGIELAWDRDPSVWTSPDGSIIMKTDRLDLRDLLGELERTPETATTPGA
jgi:catechol 2,3-dioxygenase